MNPTAAVRVTGATGALGERVLAALAAEPAVTLLDETTTADGGDSPGADVVVHLGAGDHDTMARRRQNVTTGVVDALEVADTAAAGHVVIVSSAMVYGAWPNNPVPLTEEALIRPATEFVYARQLATAEALVDRWRLADRQRTVTVLRPVVTMAANGTSQLAAALAAGLGQRFGEDDPPAQFLHLDDLVAAVVLAVVDRLDGVFNVAPDGWVAGERVRALTGTRPRLQLPDRVSEVLARVRWRLQRGPLPPGLRTYTREPWVVGNDRFKAVGWSPTVTNEEAYVEGTEGSWWTMVTPKRRQELALGAMMTAAVAAVAIAARVIVRRLR